MRMAERERLLEQLAADVAAASGFSSGWIPGPAELGGNRIWSFTRPSTRFATEALCFIYARRPQRRLTIDFVFSPHSRAYLEEHGLEQNGLADSLFEIQYQRGADPNSILPPEIRIADDTDLQDVFERIRLELSAVVAEVADYEWERWSRFRRAGS